MYNIVQDEINSVQGLGKDGVILNNVNTLTNTAANAANSVANIINSIANNKNAKNQNNYVGGNPNTQAPTTTNVNPYQIYTGSGGKKKEKDWLPWVIGGGIAVVALLFFMNNNSGGRRR